MPSDLAPGFLVAAPSLLDPNFHRSVVLLVEHREDGALGFVINRSSEIMLRDVVEQMGIQGSLSERLGSPVLVGGPVAPQTGWIVFDPTGSAPVTEGTVRVSDQVAVSASRELLEAIGRGEGPQRFLVVLGYAGWGAGQLDEELRQGVWLPVDLTDGIVFDTEVDDRWSASLGSLGIDPGRIVGMTRNEA